jgi:hypothetical protein
VTGLAFALLGAVQLVRTIGPGRASAAALAAVAGAAALALGAGIPSEVRETAGTLGDLAGSLLASQGHGFIGRYGTGGVLARNIDEIVNHPLSPLGIGYPSGWLIGDSGPIEYLLRGSVPLLICMYGALWFFLAWNVRSRREALHLFLVILGFELGFDILVTSRFLLFAPVLLAMINAAAPAEEAAHA